MSNTIKSFSIHGLFGYRNVILNFDDPYKIIVGENGLGKTTIINCLYYTLSKKFDELGKIKFAKIELVIGDEIISFTHFQVDCFIQRNSDFHPSSFYRLLESKLQITDLKKLTSLFSANTMPSDVVKQVLDIVRKRGISANASDDYIFRNVHRVVLDYVAMQFSQHIEQLDHLIDFEILYFPTYRRVESSFNTVSSALTELHNDYPFYDEDDLKRIYHSELIKFGMEDVKESISKLTSQISEQTREGFQHVLGDMLSALAKKETSKVDKTKFNEEKIDIILSRLGNAINDDDKKRILDYAISKDRQESKYLDFLISRLIDLYEDHREQDDMIKHFVARCNNYLFDKRFVYNESKIDLFLQSAHFNERLDLDCLSSGEKQIVSLFSKIYLEIKTPFYILFDEPELSLSIRWQKRLLPDIVSSGRCVSMFVATHSPFIFENEMRSFTVALSDSIE